MARCASGVIRLPGKVEANPHCGLSASRSSGMYCDASSTRRWSSSALSSSGSLVVISPSTTTLSWGTKRSGAKVPARGVSYSSSRRSALMVVNSCSAIAS